MWDLTLWSLVEICGCFTGIYFLIFGDEQYPTPETNANLKQILIGSCSIPLFYDIQDGTCTLFQNVTDFYQPTNNLFRYKLWIRYTSGIIWGGGGLMVFPNLFWADFLVQLQRPEQSFKSALSQKFITSNIFKEKLWRKLRRTYRTWRIHEAVSSCFFCGTALHRFSLTYGQSICKQWLWQFSGVGNYSR
jgi:hypothetical protein